MSDGTIRKMAEKIKFVPAKRSYWKTAIIILAVVFGLTGALFGVSVVYVRAYADKVYPGVYLGNYDLSGWTQDDIQKFAENLDRRLSREGVVYLFGQNGQTQKVTVDPALISSEAAIETISLGSEKFGQEVLKIGRSEDCWLENLWLPWYYRFKTVRLNMPIRIDRKNFKEILENALSSYIIKPRDARVKLMDISPLTYELTMEQAGEIFDYEKIVDETVKKLSEPSMASITIVKRAVIPTVTKSDLSAAEDKILRVLNFGRAALSYSDPDTGEHQVWPIEADNLAGWIKANHSTTGEMVLNLRELTVGSYLEKLRVIVDRPAENAKFVMENGKVKEFLVGRSGRSLNVAKTYQSLNSLFKKVSDDEKVETPIVDLEVDASEPRLKLTDVNDFGISGIFGAGTSTFYDSHTNRIKNIAHAVELLNGTIIKPGEEFSAIKYAGSFTSENGYLPEEIIKGNKIIKEVGGGMCQIGTTLFRMAMNSAMPITERTNHSLVVNYYADPVNGNPGTDATLYEPILDFKFLNDTESYLLLQTDMNFKKQLLTFTLWGKPDGRKGFYDNPTVIRWIPAEEPQEIQTTSLEPGEQKCQNSFRGAVANFKYTRYAPDGEKIERIFKSYYRPLPKICMTGIDPSVCPAGKTECDIAIEETPSSTPASTAEPLLAE